MVHKVVVVGDSGVGKTNLVNRLRGMRFDANQSKTIGMDFARISSGGISFNIWDTSGDDRFKNLLPSYIRDAVCVLYCVDLSTDQDIAKIRGEIQSVKELAPEAHIILVATKCDMYLEAAGQRLCEVSQAIGEGLIEADIVTSAKDGDGLTLGGQPLTNMILARIPAEEASVAPMWQGTAVAPRLWGLQGDEEDGAAFAPVLSLLDAPAAELLHKLREQHATLKQRGAIEAALRVLTNKTEADQDDISTAVQAFVAECHTILEGKHPNIMTAVYALAGAVVVAGIIAAAGFGFGIAAVPLAITSCIWGTATSVLVANSMFKKAGAVNDMLNDFSAAVNPPANEGPANDDFTDRSVADDSRSSTPTF